MVSGGWNKYDRSRSEPETITACAKHNGVFLSNLMASNLICCELSGFSSHFFAVNIAWIGFLIVIARPPFWLACTEVFVAWSAAIFAAFFNIFHVFDFPSNKWDDDPMIPIDFRMFFRWVAQMGIGQNLLVSIVMGWTSIYQLFCGSLRTRVMTHSQIFLVFNQLCHVFPGLPSGVIGSVGNCPASHKTDDTGRVNLMVGYIFHPHDTSSYPIIYYIIILYIYISTLSCYIPFESPLITIKLLLNHHWITMKSPSIPSS